MGNILNEGEIERDLEEDAETGYLEEEFPEDFEDESLEEDDKDPEEEPIEENSSNLDTAINKCLNPYDNMIKYEKDLKARIEKGPQMESAFTIRDLKDIGVAALFGGGALTFIPGVNALYGSLIAAGYIALKKVYRNLKNQE